MWFGGIINAVDVSLHDGGDLGNIPGIHPSSPPIKGGSLLISSSWKRQDKRDTM
jgi:hypothetical protein